MSLKKWLTKLRRPFLEIQHTSFFVHQEVHIHQQISHFQTSVRIELTDNLNSHLKIPICGDPESVTSPTEVFTHRRDEAKLTHKPRYFVSLSTDNETFTT